MIEAERRTTATRERVWQVLAEGWTYPVWVVGACRMRFVDRTWPAPGSRLHHSVGSWPALLDDTTSVVRCIEEAELVLQARAWPFGEARIEITLHDEDTGCRIVMREDATHGVGRFIPFPLRLAALLPRNVESLRRLVYLAERRSE